MIQPWWFSFLTFNLGYTGLFLGDYAESGSLADLSIHDRNINLLTTRFETTLGTYFRRTTLEPYIGVFGRYQLNNYQVDSELLGVPLFFDQGGPRNLAAFLVGLRGQSNFPFNLFYNAEFSVDSAQSTRILGEVVASF